MPLSKRRRAERGKEPMFPWEENYLEDLPLVQRHFGAVLLIVSGLTLALVLAATAIFML